MSGIAAAAAPCGAAVLALAARPRACAQGREGRRRRGRAGASPRRSRSRRCPIELSAIGNVEALQTVAVQARGRGRDRSRSRFREGQDVQQGDLLFTIDPRPYEAALARGGGARSRATGRSPKNAEETGAQRYDDLVKKDYVTPRAVRAACEADAEAARATVRADEAAVENARAASSPTARSARRSTGAPAASWCTRATCVQGQRRPDARHDQPDRADLP